MDGHLSKLPVYPGRLELVNESADPLRPTLFASPGNPVEVIECLLNTAGAECVIVKGKNADVKMTGCALEKSAKAYQVSSEGKLVKKRRVRARSCHFVCASVHVCGGINGSVGTRVESAHAR